MKRCVLLVLALALQSCTTSVVVQGTVPTPLVKKIPARIGVFYSDEFRHYRYEETIKEAGSWTIDLGGQNLSFYRNLLDTMFTDVVEIREPPLTVEEAEGLDGILIPQISKYGFLTPSISGLKFYSASIEYRIALYDSAGKKIGDWNIIGYGKSEGGTFTGDNAINDATVLAIRDSGARIAIELFEQPVVKEWISTLGQGAAAEPIPGASGTKKKPVRKSRQLTDGET